MRCWFVSIAASSLLVAGCSTPSLVGSETIQIVPGAALPAPQGVGAVNLDREYVFGPGDRLSIDVFGAPELSKTVQADSTGRIALPLVGELDVSGATPSQLAETVEDRLRGRYVRSPQVTVNLVEGLSKVITVDGEVKDPGLYPVMGRTTLMRAIARAKGMTEFAQQKHVVVFRTVDNQQMAALYDLRAIRRGMYEDPEVYANDVVVVGEANARRLFDIVLQGAAILTTPIVAVIQRR